MAPMIIGLGETEARVSEHGGVITSLVHQGRPILTTQFKDLNGKLRGGCHACAPWFGSSAFSTRKHGHVRDLIGEGDSHRNIAIVEMERAADTQYPWGMEYGTRTVIHEAGLVEFMAGMRRTNDGHKQAAPVNLALHPYFACENANDVTVFVNGHNENLAGVSNQARAIEVTEPKQITIGIMPERFIEMHLGGAFLRHQHIYLYIWTDAPKEYICVEPVLYNPRDFNTGRGMSLDIGQELSISMTLEITPMR